VVHQLESQLKQTLLTCEEQSSDLELVVKSRDEAVAEKEQLAAKLEQYEDNHQQMVYPPGTYK